MIKTWKHKGLKKYYLRNDGSGIVPDHKHRLKMILQMLDAAKVPKILDVPGMGFHQLKGDLKGFYSVKVSGNWRVIFQFDGEDAVLVDYLDYH